MSLSVRNTTNHRLAANENKPQLKKSIVTRSGSVQRSVLGEVANRNRIASTAGSGNLLKKPTALPTAVRKPLVRSKATASLQKTAAAATPVEQPAPAFSHNADQEKLKSYSTGLLPTVDIDADDQDPQLVSEYTNEIYLYMRLLEDRFRVQEDHLKDSCVTGKMREVLIDWLVQVHLKFKLLPETLYLTVAILDRFLQHEPTLSPSQLQMTGVTAMWVASKYEEIYAPEVNDFVVIADRSFSADQMRAMERRVLETLSFEPSRPLPLHFLRRCSKAGSVDSRQHALAKYLMELSLQEYALAHVDVSRLAAAALCLSLLVLDDEHTTSWDDQMTFYSFYRRSELQPIMAQLASIALKAVAKVKDDRAKRAAVARKYANKKFLCISIMPELTGEVVRELAEQAAV